jgi:type I restriction enzyme S subunit
MSDVPPGWVSVKLGDFAQPERVGVAPASVPDLPYLGLEHVQAQTTTIVATVSASSVRSTSYRFNAGATLYARLRPYLNKVCTPTFDGIGSGEFIIFPPSSNLALGFLKYLLNQQAFVQFTATLDTGDRPRVNWNGIEQFPCALPPLAEQDRIVAAIEEQFSRLDAGVALLERARQNLKRFTDAVSQAAITGRLVPQDSADGDASAALDKAWEAGRTTSGPRPVRRIQGITSLPASWEWVYWEDILASGKEAFRRGPFGSSLTKAIFVSSGYKVYEQYCPINDDCSFVRYYITPEKYKELEGFAVRPGDFLISCSGSLGRITQVPQAYEAGVINQALLRVRLNNDLVDDSFFTILFRSPYFQDQILKQSTGTAMANVKGVKDLKAIPLPLPTLAEQRRIVAEVSRVATLTARLNHSLDALFARATALRSAILSAAFSGKLVPQNPNDELASVLLERIASDIPSPDDQTPPRARQRRRKTTA